MRKEQYDFIFNNESNNFWYVGRREILKEALRRNADFLNRETEILDIGCGPGGNLTLLREFGQVDGLDASDEALEYARRKGFRKLIKADARAMPVNDGSYDLISGLDVFEHILDDEASIRECYRALRKEGCLLLTVPAHRWLWSGHDEALGHVRRYARKEIISKLKKSGFQILEQSHFITINIPIRFLQATKDRFFKRAPAAYDFQPPVMLNRFLLFLVRLEKILIRFMSLPLGTSMYILAKKRNLTNGLEKSLFCVECRAGDLYFSSDSATCGSCKKKYQIRDGVIFFHEKNIASFNADSVIKKDDLITRLKTWVKRYPKLFSLFNSLTAAFVGKNAKSAISGLPKGSLILNIGSGTKQVRKDVVNVDYYAFPGVSVVACAYKLPLKDLSVDAVISESLLEHLSDPRAAAAEIRRILKPGGLLYIVTPFMLGYHSSPNDYYRWTVLGLKELFSGFDEKESGSAWGPTAAMNSVLGSWLSCTLSLGSEKLYQLWLVFFMFALAPLTLLDYLLAKHPAAQNTAHGIYFIAIKK